MKAGCLHLRASVWVWVPSKVLPMTASKWASVCLSVGKTEQYVEIVCDVQGLLRMSKDYFKEPVKVVRLWVHECERVLADRMINDTDMTKFNEFRVTVTKKYFDDVNQVS